MRGACLRGLQETKFLSFPFGSVLQISIPDAKRLFNTTGLPRLPGAASLHVQKSPCFA